MRKALLPTILLALACGGHAAPPPPAPGQAFKALEEKLNRLILPEEPEVDGDTLTEAVEKLRAASVKADKAESSSQSGVNFVILSGAETELANTSGLKLRDVPLAECLRYVTSQTGMKYRVDSHAVVIAPEPAQRQPLTAADAPTDKEKRLLDKLSKIIRPTITFQDTTLEEAVEFLSIARGCFDSINSGPEEHVPINVIINVRDTTQLPHITLNLQDIPQIEAFQYMAEITGLELSLRHSALIFSEPGKSPSRPPITRDKPTETEVRASKIMLPAVEFMGTTFLQALEFLATKTRELGPAAAGLAIEYHFDVRNVPDVTLSLKHISLADALEHLATVSGLSLTCEDGKFIFKAGP